MATPPKKPYVIVGGGGHAKVVLSTIRAIGGDVVGFLDRNPMAALQALGVRYLGNDSEFSQPPNEVFLANGIGSASALHIRRTLFERLSGRGYSFPPIVHPFCWVDASVELGEGCQIFAGSIIQAGAKIGTDAIVNTRAGIDHDCQVGAHVHIAPGTTLSGNVTIGIATHVGVGATVIQGIRIGDNCLIAAGAVVIKDVASGRRVQGNPAKEYPAHKSAEQ